MIESTILVGIVATLTTLGFGYWVSHRFFSSKHAVSNKGGDFGGPSGAMFALTAGLFAGICFFCIFGRFFSPAAIEIGLITSMVGGLFGSVAGMFRALS